MNNSGLYRHSIELFLKSLIMHIHQELQIPYLNFPVQGDHQFSTNDKGKPLHIESCHSLKLLFDYLCDITKENKENLTLHAPNANWLITGRIRGYMKAISSLDDKSDYFRYPISRNQSKDKDKFSITKTKIKDKNLKRLTDKVSGKMIFATKNKEGLIQDIYMKQEHILSDISISLKKTADFFSTYHFMTRMELCNGW